MLLVLLIVFGLIGFFFSKSVYRTQILLLLSLLTIGYFSLFSLCVCLVLALVNYFLIAQIKQTKLVLTLAVIFNILCLLAFHGYEYFYEEWALTPALFGVSYLLLQFIDYAFKVYYKQPEAPTNILQYASTCLFAPKFFMGPIVSLTLIQEEITSHKTESKFFYGLNRMLLGVFKKLVLAGSLVLYVSSALDFKDQYPALTIISGACLYSLQLYFDFAGYCDIAIGAATMWGITLPENFVFPFTQKTWAAFWKSWHASLTQWLWQYVFIPLYSFFSRKKTSRFLAQAICVLAVFTSMAFFNGVKSGFFISAFLFALFYIIELLFSGKGSRFSPAVIFIFFSIGLLYFRTPDYNNYSFLTERLLDFKNFIPSQWLKDFFAPLASGGTLQDYFNFGFTLLLCLSFLFFEKRIFNIISQNKINYTLWFSLLLLIAVWGVFSEGSRFIYMQF